MMTRLECTEQSFFDKGIIVKDNSLPGSIKALSSYTDNLVIVDKDKVVDDKQMYCVLNHEELHFDYPNTFYPLESFSKSMQIKAENKIRIKTIRKLLPQKIFFDSIYKLKYSIEDISDYFSVTEEFIYSAYFYYSQLESWQRMKEKI